MTDSLLTAAPRSARDGQQWLIALDIDGTVLLEDDSLSPGVVDAVADAVANGHIVTLATGRSWESTVHVLDWLGLTPRYVVTANGATIMERDDSEATKYRRHIIETFDPTEVLTHIEQHLPDAHYMVELADGTRLFNQQLDDWNLSHANAHRVDIADMKGRQVTRVVVISDEHHDGSFNDFVERMGLHHVSYSVGWSAWLDIAPHGVDKSTALEQVRESLEIARDRVIVMGDGRNDMQMLDWAREAGGEAVVMGQAIAEVAERGSRITRSVEAGGVAHALAAIGVIGR